MTARPRFYLVFGDGRSPVPISEAAMELGRHSSCDVVVRAEGVSRRHARIGPEDDGCNLEDLGSENGTRVNGKRISSQSLRDGDVITLGACKIRFERATVPGSPPKGRVAIGAGGPHRMTSLLSLASVRGAAGADTSDWRIDILAQAAQAVLLDSSLDALLERLMDLAFQNLPAERGCLCLHDPASGTRTPKVVRPERLAEDDTLEISESIVQRTIDDGKAVLLADPASDRRFSDKTSIRKSNIHSAMCAPMLHEDKVLGFLYVDSRNQDRPFGRRHLEVFAAIAVVSSIAIEQHRLSARMREEREVRARLERYSSPNVVDAIVRGASGAGDDMTSESEVSVLFADLSGFTAFAEKLPPSEVIRILNEIYEALTQVVFSHRGTLDKFMGDGLMAIFGAPMPDADHASNAVQAGLEMHQRFRELAAKARVGDMSLRIGINSGSVIAGDMGSKTRKDYTVIGDVVNVASRLESSVARPGEVVVGPDTHRLLDGGFECEPIGEVSLKGKEQRLLAYRVASRSS